MEDILEIALEMAYTDNTEPLLESSITNSLIQTIKSFYEKLKSLFRKMITRIKKVFKKDKNSESNNNTSNDPFNDKRSEDQKEKITKLRKELNELEKETEELEKQKANLKKIYSITYQNNINQIKENTQKYNDADNNLQTIKKESNRVLEKYVRNKKELDNINKQLEMMTKESEGYEAINTKLKERESKIFCNASDSIALANYISSTLDKVYKVMMNDDPFESSQELEKIKKEVEGKISFKTNLKADQILNMDENKFIKTADNLLYALWDVNKIEKVQDSIMQKIKRLGAGSIELVKYNKINSQLSFFVNVSTKVDNNIQHVKMLYKYVYAIKQSEDARSAISDLSKQSSELQRISESIYSKLMKLEGEIKDIKNLKEKLNADSSTRMAEIDSRLNDYKSKKSEYENSKKSRDEKRKELNNAEMESVSVFNLNL